MKARPSRADIEAALSAAFHEVLHGLELEETGETLMMTFKALQNISYDIVECGDAPRELVAQKASKIARRRLPRLKRALPVWVMPEGKA